MVLAAVGADFEVVEPPELRDYVRRMGEFFVRSSRLGRSLNQGRYRAPRAGRYSRSTRMSAPTIATLPAFDPVA